MRADEELRDMQREVQALKSLAVPNSELLNQQTVTGITGGNIVWTSGRLIVHFLDDEEHLHWVQPAVEGTVVEGPIASSGGRVTWQYSVAAGKTARLVVSSFSEYEVIT